MSIETNNTYKPWTNEDIHLLNNMYQYGTSINIIAKVLNRTYSDIKLQLCNNSMDSYPLNEISNEQYSSFEKTEFSSSEYHSSDETCLSTTDTDKVINYIYNQEKTREEGIIDKFISSPIFVILSTLTIYFGIVIYGKMYPLD